MINSVRLIGASADYKIGEGEVMFIDLKEYKGTCAIFIQFIDMSFRVYPWHTVESMTCDAGGMNASGF